MTEDFSVFTPAKIVEELDRYIIGQNKAKRSVAIALRNRLRRKLIPEAIRDEIAPKNILMMGPTGCGKTEIARRLAKLCSAPFIKVEATKYTEVGYVGRDVESMIRDLMAASYRMVMEEMTLKVKADAEKRTEDKLLDLLLPGINSKQKPANQKPVSSWFTPSSTLKPADVVDVTDAQNGSSEKITQNINTENNDKNLTREKFREMLKNGKLEDKEVEVEITQQSVPSVEIISGMQMEEQFESAISGIANIFGSKKKKRMMSIKEARKIIFDEESEKLVDKDKAASEARERAEQTGIVFIDEIDKIANREGKSGGQDVSREGVQRDILPIVEGCKVNTKYGIIDTTYILFIASGAFNVSKPSDLIPELQGRFPIRVELEALTAEDFKRILTEPENALVMQYKELLKTENVELTISDDAISSLAAIAEKANTRTENIGARRLHTVMERLLEEISFDAPTMGGQKITIEPDFVEKRFKGVFESEDLAQFIL